MWPCEKRTAASFDAAVLFGEKISNALRFALGNVRGKIFFICSSETPAGVSELLFHGKSYNRKGVALFEIDYAACVCCWF
jgi:hypothetical protein